MNVEAPVLRGSLPARVAVCVVGCAAFGWGIAAMLRSGAGVAPWDVLHQGVSDRTGLSFGTVGVLVGLAAGCLAWMLGQRPGFATFINMLTIGPWVDAFLALDAVPDLRDGPLALQLTQNVVGVLVIGVGTGFYVGAGRSAGPRDSLMLAVSARTGLRLALARNGIEAVVAAAGFVLGGQVGIGTVLFVIAIGPVVEASFRVIGASPLAVRLVLA